MSIKFSTIALTLCFTTAAFAEGALLSKAEYKQLANGQNLDKVAGKIVKISGKVQSTGGDFPAHVEGKIYGREYAAWCSDIDKSVKVGSKQTVFGEIVSGEGYSEDDGGNHFYLQRCTAQ